MSDGSVLNALTIDVEDYFHASALNVPALRWEACEQRVTGNTRRLLELLGSAGTKATFFVLGWVAERNPELIREISDAGHEIGCHGYSHRLIYEQTPEEFSDETRKAKRILEDITGDPVVGYRAASFSIVEDTRWALDVIAEQGFTYDSSIFPIVHDRYGIPSAALEPHELTTPGGYKLIELPPPVLTLGRQRLPVAGGGYLRLLPYVVTRWAMRRINRDGRPVIVYLHPWEIDAGQPRLRVGPVTRFRHYVNITRVERRLERLLVEFQFERMDALARRCGDPAAGPDARDRYHAAAAGESRQ